MPGVGLGLDALTVNGRPDRGATLDFARGVYRRAGVVSASFTDVEGTAFSRAGPGGAFRADGGLVAFAAGEPRITDRGLLLEPARTNLVPWSWTTSNAGWLAFAGTKTAGQTDPTGGMGAALYTADGTASTQHVFRAPDIAVASGVTYAMSFLVRAGTADRIQMTIADTRFAGLPYANYHLEGAGQVSRVGGTVSGSGIVPLGAGWYRVWMASIATSSGSSGGPGFRPLITGLEARGPSTTSSGSFHLFAAQVEAGDAPTSPIATQGAAVARGTDAATVTPPVGCSTYVAVHGDADVETRGVVAGATFDLAGNAPWVGAGLKRLSFH